MIASIFLPIPKALSTDGIMPNHKAYISNTPKIYEPWYLTTV